jgi:hypothetical protein
MPMIVAVRPAGTMISACRHSRDIIEPNAFDAGGDIHAALAVE